MTQRLFSFVGGQTGAWRVVATNTIIGASLAGAKMIDVIDGEAPQRRGALWLLRGITSNERYVTRGEKGDLAAKQQGLGRPEQLAPR